MKITLNSIATIHNSVADKKDTGWGNDISEIIVNPEYQTGLIGLNEFSHIIVIYYLHQAQFNPEKHLVRKPQGRADMPMVGILSQRAKDRPNPIGITAVEIVKIKNNIITVKGLDAINGTPILDIKPYFPMYDCKTGAKIPDWVELLMKDYF